MPAHAIQAQRGQRAARRSEYSMGVDGEEWSNATDEALLRRMVAGDRSAVAQLYERHVAQLLALARILLRDRQEAEDLIHDVFLEAWRHCPEYSATRGTVRAWLLVRTRSRALDRLKSCRRSRQASAASAWNEGPGEPEAAESHAPEDQERLRASLLQVPEEQRRVLLLGYFEDLSMSQIADRMGIPLGTVKSRTRAALTTLRSVLGWRADG